MKENIRDRLYDYRIVVSSLAPLHVPSLDFLYHVALETLLRIIPNMVNYFIPFLLINRTIYGNIDILFNV